MRNKTDALILTRADLSQMLDRLCGYLGEFFSFSGHTLYFPEDPGECVFLAAEKRLILPLRRNGEYLGALMLEKTSNREVRKVLPFLDKIATLCLDNLAWERFSKRERRTGLFSEEFIFSHMAEKVEAFQEDISGDGAGALYKICFGMIMVQWADAGFAAHEFDCGFRDMIFESLAADLENLLPDGAFAAPAGFYSGNFGFCVLFPAQSRSHCHKLSCRILEGLGGASFRDPVSGRNYKPDLVAGHALFPQDLTGEEAGMPVFEQALRLRARADYAARVARGVPEKIMAFARILSRGGRITEAAGKGRVRINLGSAANARNGMIFGIYRENVPIGQIRISETRRADSMADVVFLEEPGREPEPGDHLHLRSGELGEDDNAVNTDNAEDGWVLSHAAFMDALAKAVHACGNFCVGIIRPLNPGESLERSDIDAILRETEAAPPDLAGFYGSQSLIVFHAAPSSHAMPFYENFAERARERGLVTAAGVFAWPFLGFTRDECEACALKALEYARLLPLPHIGLLDSLALNISADRKFSNGDSYGAIEEYKLALLADPRNAMARNSLGVSVAALGKLDEALRILEQALGDSDNPDMTARIHYNMGVILQKKGDRDQAAQSYRLCLRNDRKHFYGLIRYGLILEKTGRARAAAALYKYASRIAGDGNELALAERGLARVRANDAKSGEAASILHDALLRNPDDGPSMALLAGIYLENMKDPQTAEILARKSAALGHREAWDILARALAMQGRMEESREAAARGGKQGHGS